MSSRETAKPPRAMAPKRKGRAKAKRPPGRPRIELTERDVKIVEKLAARLPLEDIADVLGIGERTLSRRFHDDPRVLAAYKKGRARARERVAETLIEQAIAGNITACIFYLKTQAGWKETSRTEVEVDGMSSAAELMRLVRRELLDELKALGPAEFTAELERLVEEADG